MREEKELYQIVKAFYEELLERLVSQKEWDRVAMSCEKQPREMQSSTLGAKDLQECL